ncbi:hypothetical protein FOA52_011694 [Chlamydomonas sp. UWO 241]|nr:hypothetical protein FOA52_011694 [Chlamydomonas sp. UWO 241]
MVEEGLEAAVTRLRISRTYTWYSNNHKAYSILDYILYTHPEILTEAKLDQLMSRVIAALHEAAKKTLGPRPRSPYKGRPTGRDQAL